MYCYFRAVIIAVLYVAAHAVADLQYSLLDTSDVARWVASIYFATTTMTTVG